MRQWKLNRPLIDGIGNLRDVYCDGAWGKNNPAATSSKTAMAHRNATLTMLKRFRDSFLCCPIRVGDMLLKSRGISTCPLQLSQQNANQFVSKRCSNYRRRARANPMQSSESSNIQRNASKLLTQEHHASPSTMKQTLVIFPPEHRQKTSSSSHFLYFLCPSVHRALF